METVTGTAESRDRALKRVYNDEAVLNVFVWQVAPMVSSMLMKIVRKIPLEPSGRLWERYVMGVSLAEDGLRTLDAHLSKGGLAALTFGEAGIDTLKRRPGRSAPLRLSGGADGQEEGRRTKCLHFHWRWPHRAWCSGASATGFGFAGSRTHHIPCPCLKLDGYLQDGAVACAQLGFPN